MIVFASFAVLFFIKGIWYWTVYIVCVVKFDHLHPFCAVSCVEHLRDSFWPQKKYLKIYVIIHLCEKEKERCSAHVL